MSLQEMVSPGINSATEAGDSSFIQWKAACKYSQLAKDVKGRFRSVYYGRKYSIINDLIKKGAAKIATIEFSSSASPICSIIHITTGRKLHMPLQCVQLAVRQRIFLLSKAPVKAAAPKTESKVFAWAS